METKTFLTQDWINCPECGEELFVARTSNRITGNTRLMRYAQCGCGVRLRAFKTRYEGEVIANELSRGFTVTVHETEWRVQVWKI
jgi:ribosomal protein S27AE